MRRILYSYLFTPFLRFILVFSTALEETYEIYGGQQLAHECQSDPE